MPKEPKKVLVRFPSDLYERILKQAKKTESSVHEQIIRCCEGHLNGIQPQNQASSPETVISPAAQNENPVKTDSITPQRTVLQGLADKLPNTTVGLPEPLAVVTGELVPDEKDWEALTRSEFGKVVDMAQRAIRKWDKMGWEERYNRLVEVREQQAGSA